MLLGPPVGAIRSGRWNNDRQPKPPTVIFMSSKDVLPRPAYMVHCRSDLYSISNIALNYKDHLTTHKNKKNTFVASVVLPPSLSLPAAVATRAPGRGRRCACRKPESQSTEALPACSVLFSPFLLPIKETHLAVAHLANRLDLEVVVIPSSTVAFPGQGGGGLAVQRSRGLPCQARNRKARDTSWLTETSQGHSGARSNWSSRLEGRAGAW